MMVFASCTQSRRRIEFRELSDVPLSSLDCGQTATWDGIFGPLVAEGFPPKAGSVKIGMDSRAIESEILELENKLLHPTEELIALPLYFLRLITRDFSKERELGRGGYGVVYKGILRCGSVIAIKRFHDGILVGCHGSFDNEASFLMGIKHQNLVQLLGFCAESSGKMMMKQPNGTCIVVEHLTRMLCFEYVCNQGLDKHLSNESSGLEWNMRYEIIKGICSGLNFLHEREIVHLDLKPQNILLDANMMPKIVDFGLSRLLGEQKSSTIAATADRAGTMGYMAPEYIDRGIISMKADIFSLGVIIIEIIKGCRDDYPDYCQSTETDFQHFTEKVLNNWRDRFKRSLKYTTLELNTRLVKQCINIALKCVHPNKEKRPNLSNIIEILNAAEGICSVQNREDVLVDDQIGLGGAPPSGVQRDNGLVALNKIAMKDHEPPWITEGMMKSALALPQPRCEPVLDGSFATLCYQGARNASFWVAHKALASLESNLLKDWAATIISVAPNVNTLQRELLFVMGILESTLGKVIHNSALERSLMMLQDLVYDAEDVVDEMEYFCIQDMLDAGQRAKGCAHNLEFHMLPSIHDEPQSPNKLRFDSVDASQRIKHIVKQMQLVRHDVSSAITLLGSDWSTTPNIAKSRPITISESIEPKLYGRELMMKSIIDDITNGKYSAKVLTVIPIVGPGGIGKTTLAQHVYHSGEVQEHFDVRVWTCVSFNFNVNKLIEEIRRYIPKVDHENSNGTASELIGQRLKNKRFLLVLDDIWNCSDEDEWKQLLVPFRKSQVLGNIIIVTTRFPAQARMMDGKNGQSIHLQGIENKEFEELFLETVFGDDDQSRKDHAFLLETGFKIVDKLKGSPLAAKTVGRLLKTKLDLDHWKRVLESKKWEQSDGKNDIMPALKLSFEYLPSQLQQCFSYCALFPQDYKFEREELINFWIGLEVLHPSHGENKRVEDIGLSHLMELVNYGFLENKEGNDGRTCYIIHDLLHELARKVSSLECLSIDSSQSQVSSLKLFPSIRHLSINIDDTSVKDRLTLKNCVEDFYTLDTRLNVEKLRTLMIFGKHHGCFVKAFGHLFRDAKALHLVFLSGASYDVKDLLHNFDYLIHLRYIRIESSHRHKAIFPIKLSRFYHMKVLDAKHCDVIDRMLPRDMSNLVKLRHFLVQYDSTHSSIVEVGKLKSLQELRRFKVKKEDQGFELKQIGHLIELCGSLCIDKLENVEVKEEADEAKLLQKGHLRELTLQWHNVDDSTSDSTLQELVLEKLKPNSNLLKLSVKGHRGTTCPSWLGINLSIGNLESLYLNGVAWKTFPPIGEFWLVDLPREENISNRMFGNLRRLELCELTMVKKWAVHSPCHLFPFCEVFIVKDCPQLGELSFQHIACCRQGKEVNKSLFPRLKELEISNCPQLSSFPPVPWNEAPCSFDIRRTGIPCLRELVCKKEDSQSYSLTIEGKNATTGSTFWNVLDFHKLTGLTELRMDRCESSPLPYLQMLSSLRILTMSCWSNTFPFVEADNHVKYQFPVERLSITGWNASGKELTQLVSYFPKLSYLWLDNLEKVTGLGVNMRGQRATESPGPSPTANKLEQQQDARAEDGTIVASEEEHGLLLLPPQLQELLIWSGPELSLRSNPHNDSNQDGRIGGGGGLQGLASLRNLVINYCPKILSSYSSLSFSSVPFPNSLERLEIWSAVVGTEVLPLSNLTSLTSLYIEDCRDLRGEGLLSLLTQGHLTILSIRETPNFFVDSEQSWVHEQELPSLLGEAQMAFGPPPRRGPESL